MPKLALFTEFSWKNALFRYKTGAKVHTQQYGLLLMLSNDYTQNLEPPKKLNLARKIHTTRFGESHFLSLLSLHPDRLETSGLHLPKRHCMYYISTQCDFSSTFIGEMKQRSRVHSISQVVMFGQARFVLFMKLTPMVQNAGKGCERPVNTSCGLPVAR